MKVTIKKCDPKGRVSVPSSKSITIRALFCAALARGESQITHPLVSDDTNYAASVLSKVGVTIKDIDGTWHVSGGHFKIPTEELNCGESATTLRMMTALVSLLPGTIKLTGGPSLNQRPIRALVDALKMLGIKGSTATPLNPPVTIVGGTFKGGAADIAGNVSSQYITALLLIGSFAPAETVIRLTTPLTSRPYILLTLQVMRSFGIAVKREGNSFIIQRQRYEPCVINIEGDWSSASYFLALGAISDEGVLVENISTSSRQGDREMLEYLRAMGAEVRVVGNAVAVKKGEWPLKPISVEMADNIDLFPTVAALCSLANGDSELRGIQRARIKESNRVTAMRNGLTKLGVPFQEFKEYVTIKGLNTEKKSDDDDTGTKETMMEKAVDFFNEEKEPPSIAIDSYNDHRIAMAFAIIGAAQGGVTITNAECVKKTFPDFWKAFGAIGGNFNAYE
jgi:3-phosphoshikimate 1-carboxyvinyltransferase